MPTPVIDMNGLTDAKREGNQQENKRGDNQPIPNSHQSMQENQKAGLTTIQYIYIIDKGNP